ncbi:unnamed protein product [Orchesella dallaii]|uniref:F-box domain-containing protein n=1 Tax=Orchesella dallaii TaxID=48710 RepID=A0ABP1RRV3_9HEXA
MDNGHDQVYHLLINSGYFGNQSEQLNNLLRFRSVSQRWKQRIDRCLQNHPAYFSVFRDEHGYSNFDFPLYRLNLYVPRGWGNDTLEMFRRNPLPTILPSLGRCIIYSECVQLSNDNDFGAAPAPAAKVAQLRVRFLQLLEHVGTQVLHCKLTFLLQTMGPIKKGGYGRHPVGRDPCHTEPEELYKLAHSFLWLMPNLRSLELVGGDFHGYDKDQHLMTDSMHRLIENCPLPPLSHLVTLKIHRLPNPLETAALRTYSHAQKLSFSSEHPFGSENTLFPNSIENLQMPNISELFVTLYDERDFEKLRIVASNPVWNLTALQIDFHDAYNDTLEPIFRTASHFKTLRHLIIGSDIFSDSIHIQEDFHNIRLELPHLNTFKIHCLCSYIFSLDFLLPCTKLRKLELVTTIPRKTRIVDNFTTVINFHRYWHRMYDSNVWITLPKLDKMQMKFEISKNLGRWRWSGDDDDDDNDESGEEDDEDNDESGEEDDEDNDDSGEDDDDDNDDAGEADHGFDSDSDKEYTYSRAEYQSKK